MANPMYEVSVTAVIEHDGKFLITKRSLDKKRFPGLWTVPGGHVEPSDFNTIPPNKAGVWYSVLESAVRREVREEVNLEIENIRYLVSMALDNSSVIVINFHADYKSGDVKICDEATDFAWVTLAEAKTYSLIDGLYNEIEMAAYQGVVNG